MIDSSSVNLKLTITSLNRISLKELEDLRLDLFNELQDKLKNDLIEIHQNQGSRSLDPAVIGAIGLVLLPIFAQKIADILIEWLPKPKHKDCEITISVPTRTGESVVLKYNPSRTSPEQLKQWMDVAIKTARRGNNQR